jgi:hypothetical protein
MPLAVPRRMPLAAAGHERHRADWLPMVRCRPPWRAGPVFPRGP